MRSLECYLCYLKCFFPSLLCNAEHKQQKNSLRQKQPKYTFAGIIESQITRFYRICSQRTDFETACTVLFKALRKRCYSKRFLRSIKSETLANIKTSNSLNTPFKYNPNIDASSTQCERLFCPTCEYFEPRSEIVSTATKQTFKILT